MPLFQSRYKKSYAILVLPFETTSKTEEKSCCVSVAISFYNFPEVFLSCQ